MKSAAEVIVHATAGHGIERDQRHPPGIGVAGAKMIAQQKMEHGRAREFWSDSEPAALLIKFQLVLRRPPCQRGRVIGPAA